MTKYETECQARDCIYALKRKATAPLMKQRQDLMREVARLDLE